jgi:hypothetical protein
MAISSLVITLAVLGRFNCRCFRASSPRDSCAPALLTMVKAATKATANSDKVRFISLLPNRGLRRDSRVLEIL